MDFGIRGFHFLILATDISSRVLEKAKLGIYNEDVTESIPSMLKKKYLLKSKEKEKKLVRVAPEIRAHVKFRHLNLVKNDFQLREKMDIIFCRNVIIYFNRETQEKVVSQLCHHLLAGGYLFTGHSETLNGLLLPLKPVAHTVYQKESGPRVPKELSIITLKPAEMLISERPTIVRTVLGSCVAVTMFNRRLGISAICHALLPERSEESGDDVQETTNPYKYVNSVIPLMVKRLRDYGVQLQELEVKVFGGADTLRSETEGSSLHPVGKSNINAVFRALKVQNLRLTTSDVGGVFGRKILFYTHSGEVLLKRIKSRTEPH